VYQLENGVLKAEFYLAGTKKVILTKRLQNCRNQKKMKRMKKVIDRKVQGIKEFPEFEILLGIYQNQLFDTFFCVQTLQQKGGVILLTKFKICLLI
jgi:hypothetical protein